MNPIDTNALPGCPYCGAPPDVDSEENCLNCSTDFLHLDLSASTLPDAARAWTAAANAIAGATANRTTPDTTNYDPAEGMPK